MSRKGDRYGSMTDQPLCIGISERVYRVQGTQVFWVIIVRHYSYAQAHRALNRKVGVRRLIRLRSIVAVETSPRQPYRLRVGSRHLFIDLVS